MLSTKLAGRLTNITWYVLMALIVCGGYRLIIAASTHLLKAESGLSYGSFVFRRFKGKKRSEENVLYNWKLA